MSCLALLVPANALAAPLAACHPRGPQSGEPRVQRGGSWIFDDASSCRGASRGRGSASDRSDSVGFRVALSAED